MAQSKVWFITPNRLGDPSSWLSSRPTMGWTPGRLMAAHRHARRHPVTPTPNTSAANSILASAAVTLLVFGEADVYPVIVRNGVVLYAPGQLDLGRSTRLANRAQRRALRALYATCGIPGCGT